MDNIFIDISHFESYTVTLILNGLSDHDAQLLMISTDYSTMPTQKSKTARKINKYTIFDFIKKLSNYTILNNDYVSAMFNFFLRYLFKDLPPKKSNKQE
jgi:hypothetical protein